MASTRSASSASTCNDASAATCARWFTPNGVDAIVAERLRVLAGLRDQGWPVPDSQANFVWLPTGAGTSDLAADAVAHGLLVRPFAGEGIRVTVGGPAANDRVLEVAASWVSHD